MPLMNFILNVKKIRRKILYKSIEMDLNNRFATQQSELIPVEFGNLRSKIIAYMESMRCDVKNPSLYKYSASQTVPVLYASTYAAMTFHLLDHLNNFSSSDREEWLEYFAQFQSEDGLYRDPNIAVPLAESEDWWGWRHLFLHVAAAISALGGVVQKPIRFLEPFLNLDYLVYWLEGRNWSERPDFVSNEVQNLGAMLQYSRDFHNDEKARAAVDCLLDWLIKNQDKETGFWGGYDHTPTSLSRGVQTGYHLWLLFFYDDYPIPNVERIIDHALATQNKFGGFGVLSNSSACEDIDSIDPLVRLSLLSDYRRSDIVEAMQRAQRWILVNMNPDGGFVFRRGEIFVYGHNLMSSGPNQSATFPTWFRSLSIGYLAKLLPEHFGNFNFQFLNCPGYQFFK
jgi:hypothetical protein